MAERAIEPTPPDIHELARSRPLHHMDPAALSTLIQGAEIRRAEPGDTLFRLGDTEPKALFVLLEGAADLVYPSGETALREAICLLGISSYLDNQPYSASAVVTRPAQLAVVPFERIHTLSAKHPGLHDALEQVITQRIRARSYANQAPTGALARPARTAMNSPLATCRGSDTLMAVHSEMQARCIGSMGVLDDQGGLLGLVTAPDMAHAVLGTGYPPSAPVSSITRPTIPITPDTPLWRAEALQSELRQKYLVVMDEGKPAGMLSQTNILRALLMQESTALELAWNAANLKQLQRLYRDIGKVVRDAFESHRDASQAAWVISEFHLALQRRCIDLTLEEIQREGHGTAPRAYALVIMGSGGRREMLFEPDQDNGIIIDDAPGPLSEEEKQWFQTFCDRVNVNLGEVGYAICPGEIMARNPAYQKTLSEWQASFSRAAQYPGSKAARWCNIVLDFELLYGEDRLVDALWRHVLEALPAHPRALRALAMDDAEGRPPLGLFNRLVTPDRGPNRGKIDIKRQGLRIIANCARVHAVGSGIQETNTRGRVQALVRQGVLSPDAAESVIAAHEDLLDLLLAHQLSQCEAGTPLDKEVAVDDLHPLARRSLTLTMRVVKRFQENMHARFGA